MIWNRRYFRQKLSTEKIEGINEFLEPGLFLGRNILIEDLVSIEFETWLWRAKVTFFIIPSKDTNQTKNQTHSGSKNRPIIHWLA